MNDHFSFVREVRSILNTMAAVSGEPTDGEWHNIRGAVLRALLPFDEAREAVRAALSALRQLGEPLSS
jgi:Flp pilus assembly protein TadD